MSLRIRAVKSVIKTNEKNFGSEFQFEPNGLNVIRAENSKGKSSLFNSIIFALGFESILGVTRHIPLPYVWTRKVEYDDKTYKVVESYILLEVENGKGEIVTIKRSVVSAVDKNLVQVFEGPIITKPRYESKGVLDLFVRLPGSAQSEKGFYTWLAKFLAINLPKVAKFNGQPVTLFMECLFPLMCIEQKRGWTQLQSTIPMHYQIRDVKQKALEFVMSLDREKISALAHKLNQELSILERRWDSTLLSMKKTTASVSGFAEGLPAAPVHGFGVDILPIFKITYRNKSLTVDEHITALENEIKEIVKSLEVKDKKADISKLETDLAEAHGDLFDLESLERKFISESSGIESEVVLLARRIESIGYDIAQMSDAFRIQRLGGSLNMPKIENCPVCEGKLDGTVLPQDIHRHVMNLEDNLNFIKDEQKTVEILRDQAIAKKEKLDQDILNIRSEMNSIREKIRSIKSSLIEDPRLPSSAILENKIIHEKRVAQLNEAKGEFSLHIESLKQLSTSYSKLDQERSGLPEELSETDIEKIETLGKTLRSYLKDFGFSSFEPDLLTISTDTLHPVVEDLDWYFESSGSDNVRAIWAYTMALLSLSQSYQINHFGLLMFDEPRQHSTKGESLGAFFRKAAALCESGAQVIVTTSESVKELEERLGDLPGKRYFFADGAKIIQPME